MDLTFLKLEEVKEESLYEPLPDGEYECIVDSIEVVEKNNNTSLKIIYSVTDSAFSGKRLYDNIVVAGLENAVSMGKRKLKLLLEATNKIAVKDSDEFVGESLVVKVGTREWNGKLYNTVLDYYRVGTMQISALATDKIPF